MLAQGGEFAFVLLSLAAELKVLPEELNKLLIIVVVISMALTPGLASIGKYLADKAAEADDKSGESASAGALPTALSVHVLVGRSWPELLPLVKKSMLLLLGKGQEMHCWSSCQFCH